MAKFQNPPEEEECEEWLVTYADAITLLMAFFVMLVSFSKIDLNMFDQVTTGIAKEIGKRTQVSQSQMLKQEVEDAVYEMNADEVVHVQADSKGIVITLASGAFYKPGSAEIREEAIPLLDDMAKSLGDTRFRTYLIEVEGHTDDSSISTLQFPSNWELSAGRAAGVVRHFLTKNIDPERVKVAAFADTRPVAPNRDADGKPIPENMNENRRVVIHVSPLPWEERQVMLRKMEEEERQRMMREREEKLRAEEERLRMERQRQAEQPAVGTTP